MEHTLIIKTSGNRIMTKLNKPVFFLSVILLFIVVCSEAGSVFFIRVKGGGLSAPGYGISSLAFFDTLVMFSVFLIGASVFIPERIQGKIQGIITLVFSILMLISAIGLLIYIVVKLALMVTLLVTPIFGTLAYLVIFGNFDTGSARLLLGYVMFLKFVFVILIIISHFRFIENKGLVFILITSVVSGIIVSLCHAIVPGFLASITDGIAGIIVLVIAIIWLIFFLIGSVKSVLKAVI